VEDATRARLCPVCRRRPLPARRYPAGTCSARVRHWPRECPGSSGVARAQAWGWCVNGRRGPPVTPPWCPREAKPRGPTRLPASSLGVSPKQPAGDHTLTAASTLPLAALRTCCPGTAVASELPPRRRWSEDLRIARLASWARAWLFATLPQELCLAPPR